MSWLTAIAPKAIPFAVVLFGAILTRILRLRARLRYGIGHSFNMIVEEPLVGQNDEILADRQVVRTATITVVNVGKQPAKGAEVTFAFKPPIYNLWPARSFSEVPSPLGRHSIRFDSLSPGEQVAIHIMSINADLPIVTSVRSEESEGKLISMALQRVFPTWFNNLCFALILLGAGTLVYFAGITLQGLILALLNRA